MPISSSKSDTFRLGLKSDESVPEDVRPYFEFAPLTGREQKQLAKDLESVTENPSPLAIVDSSLSLIKPYLVGWGNIEINGEAEFVSGLLGSTWPWG